MNLPDQELIETKCAICQMSAADKELYPANFKPTDLTPEVFSARRLPDRLHYRIVRCQECGLVRSNPILKEEALSALYAKSRFTYEQESLFAADTYAHYFHQALLHIIRPLNEMTLLEVGCGNGFFLEKARMLGLREIFGVEPSQHAVEQAGEVKKRIHNGMFTSGLYPNEHFDIICVFQVFDHINQPNEFLSTCHRYLKRNGILLMINHNIGALTARLLGRKCPMIDIEHPFLYDKKTFRKILEKNQFNIVRLFDVDNCYPLSYWLKLAPLPNAFKSGLTKTIEKSFLAKLPVKMRLGNMGMIARK